MENGWIKLHRKILINDGLFRSAHTFTIWCWLLLNADRKTGEVKVGRHMLSRWLKIKPSTVYQTLQRLQNMTMVKLKSNNQVTTVSILNWHTYQDNITTKDEQHNNNVTLIQEVRRQEVRRQETEEDKIPNSLILSKGMKIAYAKEFIGITTTEIEEQRIKCNAYMNMSSANYKNPGLFFKGWLNKYMVDKKAKDSQKDYLKQVIDSTPEITEEQRKKNLIKLDEMRKSLKLRRII